MKDENERLHQEWLGMAQPDGLVVTATALKAAEANITWPVVELQAVLRDLAGATGVVLDLRRFFDELLGWSSGLVVDREKLPETLKVPLDGGDFLAPHFGLRSADDDGTFALLVGLPEKFGGELDAATDDKRWTATPHQKFERLLRETAVHVGLLTNGRVFRLVYAPKGESAGWIDFRVAEMLAVDGRPLLGAIHMLLNQRRILSLEPEKRLIGLLKTSREYQNTVSNDLREQILAALRELLRGFEHADLVSNGAILGELRRGHLQEVYVGIVTVLMRMVFVLFAEERGLLPLENELYANSYSLTRLYAQLVEERGRFGDGLDDRYGAWARVVTLFRVLHDGVRAADGLVLAARKGDFFSSNAFPFLEGRPRGSARQVGDSLGVPRISDGVVFRVLDLLLVLGGERLQYRGLDVEQIGSVYEGLMGFDIEVAEGRSLCLAPQHVVVNLDQLLGQAGGERAKTLHDQAGLVLKDTAGAAVKAAKSVEALQAALSRRISARQPGLIATGTLCLQPGEERRKSQSHYTPKSLTAPIVETALRPVVQRLGPDITPEQILDLKICDPAMGSAAFLVETCRQLADLLVGAWRRTGSMPNLPPDEDPVLHARRLIAQRCLYGVDRNPLAVDLARLSMWLVTFAKEHPFTFVDHALRCGDSLVGLSKEQIANLAFDVKGRWKQVDTIRAAVLPAVTRAEGLRRQIHSIGDPPNTERLVELWRDANESLQTVRMLGDAVVACFFSGASEKARTKSYEDLAVSAARWLATGENEAQLTGLVADLRQGGKPVAPFHWEVEFPEVFGRPNGGFDCIVGNPPFLGGTMISDRISDQFLAYIKARYEGTGNRTDLAAYFFRRAFSLLRAQGTLGLIATNTIAQGDTRKAGLGALCASGGTIFSAIRRMRWPGAAKVIVSVVHVHRGAFSGASILDGAVVDKITAYLFYRGTSEEPRVLPSNAGMSFEGFKIAGQGFLFDDGDPKASPLAVYDELRASDPGLEEVVRPYLGSEELNSSPTHAHHRLAINFGTMSESECAQRWPSLFDLVKQKVKYPRDRSERDGHRLRWWQYGEVRPGLVSAIAELDRVLVVGRVSSFGALSFLPKGIVYSEQLVVFALRQFADFAVLQSRVHQDWARFFSSSLEDRLRYTPSDCFHTYPLPPAYESSASLESIGEAYFSTRAAMMVDRNEGMTRTYNRFHDPDEASPLILKLRELHAQMDRVVLDAYGWSDIEPVYRFREQLDENIRLTWAEETRDEVLARLLELNRVMAEKESQEASATKASAPKKPAKKKAKPDPHSGNLFPEDDA